MLWYHVSNKFIGYTPILEPGVPDTVLMDEGNIPRVCVSNNIYFCIRSKVGREDLRAFDLLYGFYEISSAKDEEDYFINSESCKITTIKNPSVYVTEDTPYYPPDHSDFRRNNEMWFITPTQFHFIGFLSIGEIVKNRVVRLSNQQIETIYLPNDFEMNLELNPFMDPLYTNNKFFFSPQIAMKYKIDQGMIPIYIRDYGYEGFTEEKAIERLKFIGVFK